MRQFKTSFSGDLVDLDDPKIYEYLPDDTKILDDMMFKEIGMTLCYMDYFHPEIFGEGTTRSGFEQMLRVKALIKNFCNNRKKNYDNSMWYKEKIFLFQDETENMC